MNVTFEYKVVPLKDVLEAFQVAATDQPDSYRSENLADQVIQALLAEGYRWVRSEGEWAVFEKFDLTRLALTGEQVAPSGRQLFSLFWRAR